MSNSSTIKPINFPAGKYKYEISYFGKNNEITVSSPYLLFDITTWCPQLNFVTPSDSNILGWIIYRSEQITSDTNPDNYKSICVGVVNVSNPNKFFVDPLFVVNSPKINTLPIELGKPLSFTISDSSIDKSADFMSGLYKYEFTFLGLNNLESEKSVAVLYTVNTKAPKISFSAISSASILGWKIYRSSLIPTGNNGSLYQTSLVGFLDKTQSNEFVDSFRYLNVPNSSIAESAITKPANFISGKYKYEVTYFGVDKYETNRSPPILFQINSMCPKITFDYPIDPNILGWKIYRSDLIPANNDGLTYKTFLIGYLNKSISNEFIDSLDTLSAPINSFTISDSTTTKPTSFTAGSYKYQVTFYGANNSESVKSQEIIYQINTKMPKISFATPTNPNVLGWKIYRSVLIPPGQNSSSYSTNLIGFLLISELNEFVDLLGTMPTNLYEISDSTLDKISDITSGNYKYEVEFYGPDSVLELSNNVINTTKVLPQIYNITTKMPKLTFSKSINSQILGCRIYRSSVIPSGDNGLTTPTRLVGVLNFQESNEFIDSLSNDAITTLPSAPSLLTTSSFGSRDATFFPAGGYKYHVSFFGANNSESQISAGTAIVTSSTSFRIRVTLNRPSDSSVLGWKVYRSETFVGVTSASVANNITSYKMHLVGIFYKSSSVIPTNNYVDLLNSLGNYANLPPTYAITNSDVDKPSNFISGSYRYEVSYIFGSQTRETAKLNSQIYQIGTKMPQITFTISDAQIPNILGYKIYRSDLIPVGANSSSYPTRFVGFLSPLKSNQFIDSLNPLNTFTISNSLLDIPSNFATGTYKYDISLIYSDNTETGKLESQLYSISTKIPKITFNTPIDPSIIGWKIYRSLINPQTNNSFTYQTFLVGTLFKSVL